MTDPTPSPQVRDVDRALAAILEETATRWESREAAIKSASEVIARHLAPEREEAERWRAALEELSREVFESRRAASRERDRKGRVSQDLVDDLLGILARIVRDALSPAPAPQGEHKPGCAPQAERGGA